jgi:moderate conductance mechanosensitive channel
MTDWLNHWTQTAGPPVLRVFATLVIAAILVRLLRALTNRLIQISKSPTRVAQMREQQTRTVAGMLYSICTAIVVGVAITEVLAELGFKWGSFLAAAGIAGLVVGIGAQNLIKDIANGFFIVFEDQYVIGDLIQLNGEIGRVEHLTLRRTVIRNTGGAIVTIPNSLVGQVANLNRDWSQTFVDVVVPSEELIGRALATLEKVAGDFREDAGWSQALVDGPRVLGVESLTLEGTLLRLQVRTALNRKEEVARELRRRIKIGFEQSRIPMSHLHRVALQGETGAEPDQWMTAAGKGEKPWEK